MKNNEQTACAYVVWSGALSGTGTFLAADGSAKDQGAALRFSTVAEARRAASRRGWIRGCYSILTVS